MGKKKVIVKCLFLTAILLLTINSYAQKSNEMKNKIIFNNYTDTIINIEGKDILIRLEGWAFGMIRLDIQVYLKSSNESEDWMFLCAYHTNTTKVNIELNQKRKELVFKSKSGKILMTLPFETLNFTDDW